MSLNIIAFDKFKSLFAEFVFRMLRIHNIIHHFDKI